MTALEDISNPLAGGIQTMRLARRVVALLAITLVAALALVVAAKASTLVYVCGGNLCEVKPDGSGAAQLTSDGLQGSANAYASPSLSRDGTKLAFVFDNHVVVSDASAGSRGTPFATTAALTRMRPDGGAVAELEQTFSSPAFQVCTYNLDGSGRNCPYGTSSAGWAPDGSLLISNSSEALPYNREIFDCPAAGSSNCSDVVASDPSNDLYDPAASPDGSTLAVTVTNGIGGSSAGHIALYDYATGEFERDLTSGSEDELPVWSPDGSEIAFQRGGSIYVTPASGGPGSEHLLVSSGTEPTWGGSEGTADEGGASGGGGGPSGGGGAGSEAPRGGESRPGHRARMRLVAPRDAAHVSMSGAIALKLACGSQGSCIGSVTLTAAMHGHGRHSRRIRVSSTTVSIAAGRAVRAHLRLNATGRRLLRAHKGRLKVIAKLSWSSGGRPRTAKHTITLKTTRHR